MLKRVIHLHAGIIPARAGFTRESPHTPSRTPGSSPLARGLPVARGFCLLVIRIIPARAGFTAPTAPRTGSAPDHPRSRGVYGQKLGHKLGQDGSSPLARGLHLRILGIPTNPYSTRPRLPSLPT